jgi:hypothetical protein
MPLGHFFPGAFGTNCLFCASFFGAFIGYLVGTMAKLFAFLNFALFLVLWVVLEG